MANWGKIGSRGNVEDRRGFGPAAIGGFSLTGIALVFLVTYLTGGDMGDVLNQILTAPVEQRQVVNPQEFEGEDSYEVFASTVLGSNNELWASIFIQMNRSYDPAKLVLFRGATQSGCGGASSQVGPHYCPIDETIYLDETFFDALVERLGAEGGDVAEAYVISHEVGHHVQNELDILDKVLQVQQSNPQQGNESSVKLELQADCFAGLWFSSIKDEGVLEPNEIREAMDAAAAVGDDRIQEKVQGYINPESWTHGSSDERVTWFNRGYEIGELESCDTFK
jgi:predicted metalloprotease